MLYLMLIFCHENQGSENKYFFKINSFQFGLYDELKGI